MFPFLILLDLAGEFFGTGPWRTRPADIILEAWPSEVGPADRRRVHRVLTERTARHADDRRRVRPVFRLQRRREPARRPGPAYGLRGTRAWWLTRLESIPYVILAPSSCSASRCWWCSALLWRGLVYWLPGLEPLGWMIAFLRITVATVLIVAALRRPQVHSRRTAAMGVLAASARPLLWIIGGLSFGWYWRLFRAATPRSLGGLAAAMARWSSCTPSRPSCYSAARSTAPSSPPSGVGRPRRVSDVVVTRDGRLLRSRIVGGG